MYLPLNTFESSALIKFLAESDDLHAQEALVMYYLLRCNFFEAAKVNEKLSLSMPVSTPYYDLVILFIFSYISHLKSILLRNLRKSCKIILFYFNG